MTDPIDHPALARTVRRVMGASIRVISWQNWTPESDVLFCWSGGFNKHPGCEPYGVHKIVVPTFEIVAQ